MNKILDINPEEYTCLVELGVSYYVLYEKIQRRGYKNLWIDVPDLGSGSASEIFATVVLDTCFMAITMLIIRAWNQSFLRAVSCE
jgi:hypothetical protein